MAEEKDLGFELEPGSITFEPPEVLNILLESADRLRYQELKNMEIRGLIEIENEETVESPRAIDQEGNETPAELLKIIYFVTISKTLIEEDTDTSI